MTEITPFRYNDHPVRVVAIDGEPWFVLADLCKVLDLSSVGRVASRLDEGVRQTHTLETAGGRQAMSIVSEAGMYEVVLRSDKPEAVTFRRWITSEVLPSIRRTGSYGTPALTGPELMAAALLEADRTMKALTATVETQRAVLAVVEPKARAFDRWLSTNDDYSVDLVAKALCALGAKTGRNRLLDYMGTPREKGGLGMIFRQGKYWHAYQSQVDNDRLRMKLGSHPNERTGETDSHATVRIRAKGAAYLATKFGVLPEALAAQLNQQEY